MAATAASAVRPASGAQRTAWVLFAPLAAVVGLRWCLDWLAGRGGVPEAVPLLPFAGAQDPWAWLTPAATGLTGIAALVLLTWWGIRRFGAPRVGRVAAVLWLAACLAGGVAMVRRYQNVQQLAPQPTLDARVLGSRPQAASTYGPGGTLVVLEVAQVEGPQQLLVEDPQAAAWRPGQRLQLQWSSGRYSGRYVTGWQAQPAADNRQP